MPRMYSQMGGNQTMIERVIERSNQRKKRMIRGLSILSLVGGCVFGATSLLQSKLMYYYTISEAKAQKLSKDVKFRMGGIVVEDSISSQRGSLAIEFDLTDMEDTCHVLYEGLVPDLFKEGEGCVCEGYYDSQVNTFQATEILAKHDESYIPKEIAHSITKNNELKKQIYNESQSIIV